MLCVIVPRLLKQSRFGAVKLCEVRKSKRGLRRRARTKLICHSQGDDPHSPLGKGSWNDEWLVDSKSAIMLLV